MLSLRLKPKSEDPLAQTLLALPLPTLVQYKRTWTNSEVPLEDLGPNIAEVLLS